MEAGIKISYSLAYLTSTTPNFAVDKNSLKSRMVKGI